MSVEWSMAGRWTIAAFTSDGRNYHEGPAGTATDPGWDRVIAADYGSVVIAERFVRQNVPIRTMVHGHTDLWAPYRHHRRVRVWTECETCHGDGVYDVHEDDGAYDSVVCDGCDGGYLWVESSQG